MNARIFLVALMLPWAGTLQAGTVLVIDDFTDPVGIQYPGRPDIDTVQSVGDLGAERTLYRRSVGGREREVSMQAGIGSGEFFIDMDHAGEATYADLIYRFPVTDFSEYEALIIDVSLWPHDPIDSPMVVPPGMRVTAVEAFPRPFIVHLARDLQRGVGVGRVVLPLDSFTNRGGGPIVGTGM